MPGHRCGLAMQALPPALVICGMSGSDPKCPDNACLHNPCFHVNISLLVLIGAS